jgi:hypothetical protein
MHRSLPLLRLSEVGRTDPTETPRAAGLAREKAEEELAIEEDHCRGDEEESNYYRDDKG